jgi:hypothetical protein
MRFTLAKGMMAKNETEDEKEVSETSVESRAKLYLQIKTRVSFFVDAGKTKCKIH